MPPRAAHGRGESSTRDPGGSSSASPVARRVALGLLALASALGGLELVLRSRGACSAPAVYFDPDIGYRGRPDQRRWMVLEGGRRGPALSTNELGFRGALPPRERTAGVARVIALGDSFTFGVGVEDGRCYPAQLQAHLTSRLSPERAEVLNLSFPGWGVECAAAAFTHVGVRYSPDVVVLGFTTDDLRPPAQAVRYTDLPVVRHAWRSAVGELLLHELLPRLPGYRVPADPQMASLRRGYARADLEVPRDPTTELARPYVQRAMEALARLDREVSAQGGRLVVVFFPAEWQVRPLRKLPPGAAREALREQLTALQAVVREHCSALDIPFLDALEILVESEAAPFGSLDPNHPDAAGYRLLAESIGDWLLEAGHLSPP